MRERETDGAQERARSWRNGKLRIDQIPNQNDQEDQSTLSKTEQQKEAQVAPAIREKPRCNEEQKRDRKWMEPANPIDIGLIVRVN